jgi:hypothetical protein
LEIERKKHATKLGASLVEGLAWVLKHLDYSTPFVYAAAAFGFFNWLDKNASDQAKVALVSAMKLRGNNPSEFTAALVEIFDRIYSRPLLSRSAFLRSALFTVVVSAAFLFELNMHDTLANRIISGDAIGYLLGISLVINVVTDYVSLFAIRQWLILSGAKIVLALSIGAAVGVVIVLFGNAFRAVSVALTFDLGSVSRSPNSNYFISVFPLLFQSYAVLCLPAMVVFVWLPLFALAITFFRGLDTLFWLVGRTQWFLQDGEQHPLRAVGYAASIIVFVVAIGWQQALAYLAD